MQDSETTASETTVQDLRQSSIDVIAQNQTESGAYPACPRFAVYRYCWFRDGSFIADAMSRAGQSASAERFFDWCAAIIVHRKDTITSGGRLDARYTFDGQESQEDWGSFQLDGYGTWLWALKNHEVRSRQSLHQYDEAVALTVQYLVQHWREPCNDWWEEQEGLHPASLASIYAGLSVLSHPEAEVVRQAIKLDAVRTDASLLACALFKAVTPENFEPVLQQIEMQLISPSGGVYRYRDDEYYGGGAWPVLTAMLGWYYAEVGRTDEAKAKLTWLTRHVAADTGWMPEQVEDYLLHPDKLQQWIDRWGPSATPLLWSHAMFLTLTCCLIGQTA